MDECVNDFLNEINEIAPLATETKEENVWEKCLDDDSGYYYYWNTKTNEVTWDMPLEYRASNKPKKKPANSLYIPPRTVPLFPSTGVLVPPGSEAKIYKIGEAISNGISSVTAKISTPSSTVNDIKKTSVNDKKEEKSYARKNSKLKPYKSKSSSDEDEKIVLISSYGGDSSESEDEECKNQSSKEVPQPKAQNKSPKIKEIREDLNVKAPQPKVPSFSLVAGYNSDSEDESNVNVNNVDTTKTEPSKNTDSPKASTLQLFPIAPPDVVIPPLETPSHSTLFPSTKPIDPKDFEPKSSEGRGNINIDNNDKGEDLIDSKLLKRKRRIGVSLVNTGVKKPVDIDINEKKGLGFSAGDEASTDEAPADVKVAQVKASYPGFESGGVLFVKNESSNGGTEKWNDNGVLPDQEEAVELDWMYTVLREKLGFLAEGRETVSPVQVMLIQLETLNVAIKSGDLRQNYLRKWLDETSSELIQLEKEAAPEGWVLQWDRSHKRYFYQNSSSGESQWEYPQPDVTVCDEAMDICTTPPPSGTETAIHMSPPLPPVIRSPTPPPPPTISDFSCGKTSSKKRKHRDIPLPLGDDLSSSDSQPLPPGVEDANSNVKDTKDNRLANVLDSFYSDIAAIETTGNSPPRVQNIGDLGSYNVSESSTESPSYIKKKKKSKGKLSHGIAMKKKGVSKLVEKWKTVSYYD